MRLPRVRVCDRPGATRSSTRRDTPPPRPDWRVTALVRESDADFVARACAEPITELPGPVTDAAPDAGVLLDSTVAVGEDGGSVVTVALASPIATDRGLVAATVVVEPGIVSVRALGTLGLADEVAGRATGIHRQRTLDHRGRTLFEAESGGLWHGVAPCLALSRADLHQALLAGVGDVPVRWGESLEAVAFDDAGVTVTVGGSPTLYVLVLGADGVHSTVR